MGESFYKGKKVLVAGGTGLIGKQLVNGLIEEGAKVKVASLDHHSRAHPESEFFRADLREYSNCMEACEGMDYVFNLLCIKGSPKTMKEKPASIFVPMILFNTNLMAAAKKSEVDRFLYTSTIGVYSPAEIFYENDVWNSLPSRNDWYAGHAKRMGELQAEAYEIEHGWKNISIVRPANTYGPFDDFDSENSTVIPSLIKRVIKNENPLTVWGDGSPVRDFIYSRDVAKGMMIALEKNPGPRYPINLGSGKGRTIKELAEIIVSNVENKPKVIWDTSKPAGDKKRVLDVKRATSLGIIPKISLEEGIKKTMEWYKGKN